MLAAVLLNVLVYPLCHAAPARKTSHDHDGGMHGLPFPRRVVVMSLSARIAGNMVSLEWETGPEADTVGFHVFRMDSENGPGRQVNKRLLPGLLVSPGGGTYRYVDNLESSDPPLYYRLIRVDSEGRSTFAGQCEVKKGTSSADYS